MQIKQQLPFEQKRIKFHTMTTVVSKETKKKIKVKQHQKTKEIVKFEFTSIKELIQTKQILNSLPNKHEYKIEEENDYLRKISSVLPVVQKFRIEQMTYIVNEQTLSKLINQLTRQTRHKQIILVLLKSFLKGQPQFISTIKGKLYECLAFAIEIDQLAVCGKYSYKNSTFKMKQKDIETISIEELLKSIIKWYSLKQQYRQIVQNYIKLLETMRFNYQKNY